MAIEGRGDAAIGGRIRLGMIGGGEGAFIGAVHRLAARMDAHYDLVAGALSSTADKARRSGEALGLAEDRIYDDFEAWRRPRPSARRRRGGRDRHPQSHPRRPGDRLPEGRHSCHLRQAARAVPRRGPQDRGRGEEVGQDLRAHPQLYRLSAGAPGARAGAGRRPRRTSPRAGRVSAGLADARPRRPATSRRNGEPTRSALAPAARSAASAPTPITSPTSSAGSSSPSLGRPDELWRGAGLDDNVQIMLRYKGGARGALWASQVAPGNENGLKLRVLAPRAACLVADQPQ